MPRTLVAGFGNVLRGDDGFGVEVIRRLRDAGAAGDDVELLEVGTGGLHLAQELLGGYDQLIVVDAVSFGRPPGTVSVREVEGVEPARDIDMHLAIPSRALAVAQALGGLPARVYLVGAEPEPATLDDLHIGLSAPLVAAVDEALDRITRLLAANGWSAANRTSARPPPDDGSGEIAARDEVLELLYWLEGEALSGVATVEAMTRFMARDEAQVRRTVAALLARGDVVADPASGEFRLSDEGRREAGRRFAQEFAPLLSQGHGECSDPDCDCHTNPDAAAECHAARTHQGHQH
jgi:hydrogenase maturation protease